MSVYAIKTFSRWARREGVSAAALRAAVDELTGGLVDARLGGGLVKKRVPMPGQGKRGAYRTIVAADFRGKWFFLYGFSKSERDNIDDDELKAFKRIAAALLAMSSEALESAIEAGELKEIENG